MDASSKRRSTLGVVLHFLKELDVILCGSRFNVGRCPRGYFEFFV